MKLYVVSRLLLKFPMNRVSDDDPSTLLSFLSCGALQNDEIIIGILKVLSSTSGSAHGWRCAASTGWRRGSSSSWCPTPPFSSPSRTRAWPVEAHFVKLAYLARQSHDEGWLCNRGRWLVACIRDVLGGVELVLFSSHLSFAVRVSGGFCMLSL